MGLDRAASSLLGLLWTASGDTAAGQDDRVGPAWQQVVARVVVAADALVRSPVMRDSAAAQDMLVAASEFSCWMAFGHTQRWGDLVALSTAVPGVLPQPHVFGLLITLAKLMPRMLLNKLQRDVDHEWLSVWLAKLLCCAGIGSSGSPPHAPWLAAAAHVLAQAGTVLASALSEPHRAGGPAQAIAVSAQLLAGLASGLQTLCQQAGSDSSAGSEAASKGSSGAGSSDSSTMASGRRDMHVPSAAAAHGAAACCAAGPRAARACSCCGRRCQQQRA